MSKCLCLRVKLTPRQIIAELIECFDSSSLHRQLDTNKLQKERVSNGLALFCEMGKGENLS